MQTTPAAQAIPEDPFVRAFLRVWEHPSPESVTSILHDDVRLFDPMTGETFGRAAAREQFARVFRLLPDFGCQVLSAARQGDVVLLELILSGTLAGKPLRWRAVDRFTLDGERARERVSYFDALSLTLAIATHPAGWSTWWRSGLRLGRGLRQGTEVGLAG
jgi:ketosteroid isomerase-like protein